MENFPSGRYKPPSNKSLEGLCALFLFFCSLDLDLKEQGASAVLGGAEEWVGPGASFGSCPTSPTSWVG